MLHGSIVSPCNIIIASCRCIVSKAAADVDVASVNKERTVKACEDLCRFAYNESHRKRLMQVDTILAVKARSLPPTPAPTAFLIAHLAFFRGSTRPCVASVPSGLGILLSLARHALVPQLR